MYTLIVPKNEQGYLFDAIIKSMVGDKVHTVYSPDIDFSNLQGSISLPDTVHENSHIIFIVGVGLSQTEKNDYQNYFSEELEGLPFTRVYHTATWGEILEGDYACSKVDPKVSPLMLFKQLVEEDKMLEVKANVGNTKATLAMNEYQNYNFLHHRHSLPLLLLITAQVYKENTYKVLEMTNKGVTPMYDLWEVQYDDMQEYIQGNVERSRVLDINPDTIAVVTYAEKYQNEIAHALIDRLKPSGRKNIIAFIGRRTKGDDMFQVRATPSIHVGDLVYKLSNGRGNAHAGSVYLGQTITPLVSALKEYLSEIL